MNPSAISTKSKGLLWPKLISGTLIKRYKRFMADVRLKNGDMVTAHCPNTGSMQECCESGRPVYFFQAISSVRPETRIFVLDQGLRKILPQAYS